MDQLIRMIVNMLMRQFIKRGINSGINHFAGPGKPKGEMTPDERKRAQDAKAIAKRAQMAAKIARRMGRF